MSEELHSSKTRIWDNNEIAKRLIGTNRSMSYRFVFAEKAA